MVMVVEKKMGKLLMIIFAYRSFIFYDSAPPLFRRWGHKLTNARRFYKACLMQPIHIITYWWVEKYKLNWKRSKSWRYLRMWLLKFTLYCGWIWAECCETHFTTADSFSFPFNNFTPPPPFPSFNSEQPEIGDRFQWRPGFTIRHLFRALQRGTYWRKLGT